MELEWKNSVGCSFKFHEIIELIEKFPSSQIHVGTDSHFKSGKLIFATVIAVYSPGICSKYFFKRKLEDKTKIGLSSRLLKEVEDSIEIANKIREIAESRKIFVHADISQDKKNKSNVAGIP